MTQTIAICVRELKISLLGKFHLESQMFDKETKILDQDIIVLRRVSEMASQSGERLTRLT